MAEDTVFENVGNAAEIDLESVENAECYAYVSECEEVCLGHFLAHRTVSGMASKFDMSESMVKATVLGAWRMGVERPFMLAYVEKVPEAAEVLAKTV